MRRVAAIDCGTNSIRLLIAEVSALPGGSIHLTDLVREMRIVRLGQGVDQTGELAPEAVARTLEAVEEYRQLIAEHRVDASRFVATSAMRDASNGQELVARVRDILGVQPEIIPGSEEAELSFRGATSSLSRPSGMPSLVVDIGGGSTEFVFGVDQVAAATSINMGSVRVTERFGIVPGATASEEAAVAWIDAQLDEVEGIVDLGQVRSLIGVAGTVTTLAAQHLGVTTYSPDVTHGAFLSWDEWQKSVRFMVDEPVEVKAALGFMPRGRADVIGAGALIWGRVLERVRVRTAAAGEALGGAYVSEHDILDGIAQSIALSAGQE